MEISRPRRILLLSYPSLPISTLRNSTPPKALQPLKLTINTLSTVLPLPLPLPAAAPLPTSSTSTTTTTTMTTTIPASLPEALSLKTAYYAASIPIWHDTISSPTAWKQDWLSMSSEGAGQVVREIGSVICVFERPGTRAEVEAIKALLRSVADVLEYYTNEEGRYGSEDQALMLAVSVPSGIVTSTSTSTSSSGVVVVVEGAKDEDLEDLGMDCGGWEWVNGGIEGNSRKGGGSGREGRNEFGEAIGLARIKEALEANDWEGGGGGMEEDEDPWGLAADLELSTDKGSNEKDGSEDFGVEIGPPTQEMRAPMLSPQEHLDAIFGSDGRDGDEGEGDIQVQALERMMLKMQAVKDMGAGMPEAERKKFAAKAVADIMKNL
ncbi:MAG: hypothetical protein MMC33_009696 [Icmadophila ericetorum]|nr:hypothetical protein [Icmadophila ericetorum]